MSHLVTTRHRSPAVARFSLAPLASVRSRRESRESLKSVA